MNHTRRDPALTDMYGIVNRRWYITYYDPVALDNGL